MHFRKRSVSDEYYNEESLQKTFSSMGNSIESSKETTLSAAKRHSSDTSEEEEGEEGRDSPVFQCLKTNEERLHTLNAIKMTKYDNCK